MSLTWHERQDAKSLRPHLPSIVEIIDHREPDYAQLAELNLPTRSKVTEVGIGDRSGFRHFTGRSLFVYIRSFLEEMREKNRKVSCAGTVEGHGPSALAKGQAEPTEEGISQTSGLISKRPQHSGNQAPPSAGIHVYPSVPSLIRSATERNERKSK